MNPHPPSSLPFPQGDDVCLSPVTRSSYKDSDEPNESELIKDPTSPKDFPTPSLGVAKPPPAFPNRLKRKKVQSYVDKIKKTFSQVKINIPLLDVI